MNLLFTIIVTFFAGMGAGLGTGFAGMSAAAVISPIVRRREEPADACAAAAVESDRAHADAPVLCTPAQAGAPSSAARRTPRGISEVRMSCS